MASNAWSQADLLDTPLEQLMNMKITSVHKKEEPLSKTAAAVFVIGRAEISRSGARSIPELLRLAPGVNVARVNNSTWAVSIRGFNAVYSNKVLVLVDGRSVYTSMFSGVFWDQLDIPLEEIERIEVIRGPGASVWGANAVSGVINIITRSSADHGGSVSVQAGTQERGTATLQYGAAAGSRGNYRAYARAVDMADTPLPGGGPGADRWRSVHGGFRSDWQLSDRDSLTVEGDAFNSTGGEILSDALIPTPISHTYTVSKGADGGSLLAHWSHTTDVSDQSLQISYAAFHRLQLGLPIGEVSLQADYQNHRRLGSRHDVVWGLGYRTDDSHLNSTDWLRFNPARRDNPLYSAFLQDEVQLADRLSVTLGLRVEHNSYTGIGLEPGVRIAWTTPYTTVWASASQADRQPNREETSVSADLGWVPVSPGLLSLAMVSGNPNLRTEQVRDYEAGYRREIKRSLSVDVATFYSSYRHLSTLQTLTPSLVLGVSGPYLEVPEIMENNAGASVYGGELAVSWDITPHWRIAPSYSLLRAKARVYPGFPGDSLAFQTEDSPEHVLRTQSLIDLPHRLAFDQTLAWTSNLGAAVPSYWRLDLRLSRRFGEGGELSIVGENLLRPSTLEFTDTFGVVATQSQRGVYGRVAWRF